MRFHLVASLVHGAAVASVFVATAFVATMIATISGTRAWAQVESTPASPASPDSPAPGASPTRDSLAPLAPERAVPMRVTAVGSPGGPQAPEARAAAPSRRLVASLSHDLQFGLALLFGDGYRGTFPYHDMIDCGDAKDPSNRFCTNRAPVFIDVQPSFGISNSWDFLVDVRFGLVEDFNLHRQFFVMPGFRYWLDPQSHVKFFTTLQLAYDRSKQNDPAMAPHPVGDNDLGFRNSNGLMIEVMRNFGVYVQFGETIEVFRWLSFQADAGIGIQARVP
jgi:hypothetical protein